MIAERLVRRLSLGLCLTVLAACVLNPEQGAPEFGQPGKDVEWLPTPEPLVSRMLDLAGVTPKDYVIDLGSGDGRIVIAAAKRGARGLGIELDPGLVQLSMRNAAREGVGDRTAFLQDDMFGADLSKGTVITMFLLTDVNLRLRPKLLALQPGTRIVSFVFAMGEWMPDETATTGCGSFCTAYLWIVPADVAGTWRLPQGDLALAQRYQMISGTLSSGGRIISIANGRLRGDRITFTAGDAEYTGRVAGDTIAGSFRSGSATGEWTATRVTQRQPAA